MAERLVVCLRMRGSSESDPDGFSARAEELCRRATALGGRITAWHVGSFAFDFALDGLEDALELLIADPLPEGFGVGVAQGALSAVIESGSRITLSSGPALVRASALARLAQAGEVLLDEGLSAVKAGEILTLGERATLVGGNRLAGLRLDMRFPLRAHVESSVTRLVEPPWIGQGALDELVLKLEPGKLCVLSADPGTGGTRALAEIRSRARLPALLVAPADTGEPLGALRVAILRADLENPRRGRLPEPQHASLARLLAGEGTTREAGAALVGASVGANGLVLVDDAGDVDSDTLEVLAAAIAEFGLRAVVRIAISDFLPAPLTELARGAEPILGALEPRDLAALAQGFVDGAWPVDAATRFCARADSGPLALREAMAAALESGELVWSDRGPVPRFEQAAPGKQGMSFWIDKRLGLLTAARRAVLEALAVVGGRGTLDDLGGIVERRGGIPEDVERIASELDQRHWLRRMPKDVLLETRSARRAILEALGREQRAALHAAASRALEASGRRLSLGSAALHAMLAGERERALELARGAAKAAADAGLSASARALNEFAARGERAPLAGRGLTAAWSWDTPSIFPRRSSAAPAKPPPPPPRRSQPSAARAAASEAPKPLSLSGEAPAKPSMKPSRPAERHASEPPWAAHAAQALKEGDWESVQRLVVELRETGESSLAADRLEAMAELARGEIGEALRLLRQGKERAQTADAAARSRAALALGVALATAGRLDEALLEALEALARARECEDSGGGRACARFLAQLSAKAGQDNAARGWLAVADAPRNASAAPRP